jgi:succinoglycan biosynthesis transport protein ExoP
MFDTEDRKTGERGGSLLSLGRAIEEERAKLRAAEPASVPLHPDAAARHQKARSRRESQAGTTLDEPTKGQVSYPKPEPVTKVETASPPVAGPSEGAGILRRLWKGRSDGPAAAGTLRDNSPAAVTRPAPAAHASAPHAHVVAKDQLPMSDTVVMMDRTDDDGWRPLIDPAKVLGGIADSKGLIVATTLLGALLGAGLAVMTPKKYEAYAEVLVDPRNLKLVDRDLTDVAGLPSDATLAIIENQVRVLTSSTVLNRVVDKLNLESDPEFNGSEGGLDLNPINFVRSLLTRSDGTSDPARSRGLTVQTLAENVHVERTGKTFTILVGATAQDPQKAALIANTMVSEFVETADQRESDTAGRATDELTGKLAEMRRNVEAAERKVEQFKAENDIIDAQGRLITDDEIVKLNDQLSIAKARTLELSGRAQSIRTVRADDVLNGASPEAAASGVLTELRAQYAAAKQEAERLSVRLGPRHPQYQAAQAQLDGAREQIGVELRRINAQVQTELRRAVQLEQELAARLAQLKVRQGDLSNEMVTLRELEREASTQRSVYEAFLLRARETDEQKDISTANISVISEAQPPLEASGASRAVVTATGAFLGLLAGLGLGGARGALESLRETSRSRRRRTAAVRKPGRPETVAVPVSGEAVKPQPKATPVTAKPAASVAKTVETSNTPKPDAGEIPAKENPMNALYVPPGYYPQQSPANGHPAPPQPFYPQAPQAYPQHPTYPPAGYAQPGYAAPAYPQSDPFAQHPQGWPQPAQGYYPPPAPPHAMTAQPAAFAPYPPPGYPTPYPQAPGYPPAQGYAQQPLPPGPQPASAAADADAKSLSEIKESIREFRDAVRELTESRTRRRYF